MRLPAAAYGNNVQVVDYCELDDRPAFKMAIREVGADAPLWADEFFNLQT